MTDARPLPLTILHAARTHAHAPTRTPLRAPHTHHARTNTIQRQPMADQLAAASAAAASQ